MEQQVQILIDAWLREDIGPGDVTSEAVIAEEASSTAEIIAKQDLVLAGSLIAREVLRRLDPWVQFTPLAHEGARVPSGGMIAQVQGKTRALLAGERLALNLLQHLSGIATQAARYAEAIKGTRAEVLDTRKTLPGLRMLEKYAVRVGGCRNHRFGLYDGVLVKDNHIAAAGGIIKALAEVRKKAHPLLKIEVEVKTLDEVREALAAGANVIMLDNMTPETVKKAVSLIAGRVVVEASGNVTLANIRAIAETGVDFISSGSLTHSAPAADISMKIR
ncbi:MAG: carboxylating nicotinate-nucleotide diphosphorylase [Nitrospiraceae bacterium]|nr:carboxylating nicotinate-nucleotide diphosphorylase [Nitrospiraceae bacterium]